MVNEDHLNYFKLVGRVIGKALYDNALLDIKLTKALYRMMVGDDLHFEDIKEFSSEIISTIKHMIQNNDSEAFCMTFAVNDYFFDPQENRDHILVENGDNVDVNEENKFDYI
jgi:E3 ubiquitin-protein ligase HUWE1